jgi:teichoic acid transport system ATP-binding protein
MLEEMMAAGMTCLFVTHDLGAVVRFCHRAVVLFQGRKIFEGDPRQACNVLNKIYFGEVTADDKTDYGDGSAMIDQIWFEDTGGQRIASIPSRTPLVFCFSCRFNTDVNDPVFGFHIKTIYGVEVCTAATDYMGYEFGQVKRGERLTLRWTLDLNLNPGTYFFGCGCRYPNESRFLSRRVDAVKFPIVDNPTFGGIVNVFRDLKVDRTEEAEVGLVVEKTHE